MLAVTLLLIDILLFAPLAHAQLQDADLPLNIEADQLLIDEKNGRSIYQGNVKISRGSLEIKGDKITIQSNARGELEQIKVEGSPASFKQFNDKQQLISAQARELVYLGSNGILSLHKDAILVQNQNTFKAENIIYNTRTDIVQAGQKDSPEKPARERVFITIQPENTAVEEAPKKP